MNRINKRFNALSVEDKEQFFKDHKTEFQSFLNAERKEYRRNYYKNKRATDKAFIEKQKEQQRAYHARKREVAKVAVNND